MTSEPRGFTLLIALILMSVILAVSAALFDITYKQIVLSATASQSQSAFYNADSALECALLQDEKNALFDYTSEPTSGTFSCQGQLVWSSAGQRYSAPTVPVGQARITTFNVSCDGTSQNINAQVTVMKQSTGATTVYANGFNTCNSSDSRRIERGEKVTY